MTPDTHTAGSCLDLETLAAFIDQRLAPEERARCQAHLADCEDCYETFIETVRNVAEDRAVDALSVAAAAGPPVEMRSIGAARMSRREAGWYRLAAGIAAMVVLAVVAGRMWQPRQSEVDRQLRELMALQGHERATVARTTATNAWARAPEVHRGSNDARHIDPAVTIAAAKLEQEAMRKRTPETLHALGISQLIVGRTDEAVSTLEDASRLDSGNTSIWVDLGAAYYERSSGPNGALNVPKGLEAVDTAISLDGSNAAAWFNKALLLERLHMRDQAIAAWQQYLQIDGDSPWSREARQRLSDLEKAGARLPADTQPKRDALLDDVLGRWGEARGKAAAASAAAALTEAKDLARELTDASSDRFAADVVSFASAQRASRLARVAAGHAAYRAARVHYKNEDFDRSAPLFEQAARELAPGPGALVARLYEGIIRYRRNDFAGSISTLAALQNEADRLRYAGIAGRAAWVKGVALEVSGSTRRAMASYVTARRLLVEAGESANTAFVAGLIAGQLDLLGDTAGAWEAWASTFEGTTREGTLLSAAISADGLGWRRAALDLQDAAADAARKDGRLVNVADALRSQAVTYAKLGQLSETRQRLDEAKRIASGKSGAAWDRMRAEVDLSDAAAPGASTPSARIASATRALEYFSNARAQARLPEVLVARANANDAAGDLAAAYRDAREATTVLSSLGDDLSSGLDQMRFADTVRGLVQLVVDLDDRRGDLRDAFDVVEKTRARDLPDAASLTLADVERLVPADTVLASFVVGRDRSYVWVVRGGRTTTARIMADRDLLRRLADEAGPPRFDRGAARELRRLVIDPVLEGAAPDEMVVIVPDGPLYSVCFAALPGSRSNYLIEEHPIVLSPSARAWIFASSHLTARPRVAWHAFVAGNSRVDAARYAELPDLPGANAEALAVARIYGTRSHSDTDVTRRAVLAGFHADVVHFAGHAVVNDRQPSESALVVWDPDGPGVSAGIIRRQDLRSTRLVVLAACRGSSGPSAQTEGPISLARAFLAAGAANVVASSWPAPDRASTELMIRFHQAFAATGDAPRALQSAQIALAGSDDESLSTPAAWAGFAAFGGGSRINSIATGGR